MPDPTHSLISYLRTVSGAWRNDPRDDAELLTRFAESRDETAFATLVGRHGALVWQTCRRLLGNTPDAEDAFQTTFLALARKAGQSGIKSPAGWLHRVARQTALDARSSSKRRQQGLKQHLQEVMKPEVENPSERTELFVALDEELVGLPEKLRVPLLLRYLENNTLEEVARLVGCSRRVLGDRLTRGEAILRAKLERRGLALGIGPVVALLSDTGGAPAMPVGLIQSTTRAAVAFRAGTLVGGAADGAQKLLQALTVKGAVKTSWWVMLACVGFLGIGGVGIVAWKMFGDGSKVAVPPVPASPEIALPKTAPPKVAAGSRNERVDRFGDPLPEGALARIGTLRFRLGRSEFNGPSTAFLPDGKTLVSVSGKTICFWEWATGKKLRRFETGGPDCNGRQVAVSSDGKMLATGGEYWDLTVDPPRRLKREKVQSLLDDGGVAFSPDNQTVAWGGVEKRGENESRKFVVYLADASTGKVKKTLKDAEGRHLAFSADGKTLAIGGGSFNFTDVQGGGLALWDVATGAKRLQIARVGNLVSFLAFLPDGRTLLESRKNGRCLGEMLTASDGQERMRFLDADTGEEQQPAGAVRTLPPFCYRMGSKSLSQDGKLLALSSAEAISVWDLATGREVGPAGGIHFPVDTLVFSLDGKKLATLAASLSTTDWYMTPEFQIWDTDTGRLEKESSLRSSMSITSVHYCSDARHLEMLCNPNPQPSRVSVRLLRWDTRTEKIEDVKEVLPDCCDVSSDGRWQARGLAGSIVLVDRATGKEVRRFTGLKDPSFVAFAADGQSILIGIGTEEEKNQRLEVWSVVTGKPRISLPVWTLMGECQWPTEPRRSCALSPDGRWLAAITGGQEVRLLEVASGIEHEGFKTPGSNVTRVAWSPDARFLAGGDGEGTVWLWDVVAGQKVRRFTGGHLAEVTALAFSPDGLRLASGSSDTTALVWDLRGLSCAEIREKDLRTADALWVALGGKDPAAALRSIHLLTRMPDAALALLRERLRPTAVPDPKQVAMLLNQLDDDNFQVRQRAEEQLRKMGEGIEPVLQEALARKPSPELQKSINRLLNKIFCFATPSGLHPRQLQDCRGVEVLERIGTPAARQVLEELSRLPQELIEAQEAKAALHRLMKPVRGPIP